MRMSRVANCIMDWAVRNHLTLIVAKTKAIILGTKFYVNDIYSLPNLSVNVGGSLVPFESSVRSLDVVFDNKLTWKKHVDGIAKRVHSVMYRLRFFRASTTFALRKHLVESLVFRLVDYCCLVYGGMCDEFSVRIQRLINMGIRYIFGVRRDDHVTRYREQLCWMSCETRRTYFLAFLTYRILKLGEPGYLAGYFVASETAVY